MSARLARALLDALLPALCPLCSTAAGPGLCAACSDDLQALPAPCPRCGAPRAEAQLRCCFCRDRGLAFLARVHVHWAYCDAMESLVRLSKANADPAAVATCLALLQTPGDAFDAVVPVPPAPGRTRGPHLPSACARRLAARGAGPLRRLLRMRRLAAPQHQLGSLDRQRNVAGLFDARPAPERVLLVDDLLTTGATASAAARSLRRAGARRVELCCLARTPDPP